MVRSVRPENMYIQLSLLFLFCLCFYHIDGIPLHGNCSVSTAQVLALHNSVKKLTVAVKSLLSDKASLGKNVYPVKYVDGVRWRVFWWFKAGTPWPRLEDDVLGEKYGTCRPGGSYCFSRLPARLIEDSSEMLGEDSMGNIYRWTFSSTNAVAHATWGAFHDHKTVKLANSANWKPKVVKGKINSANQDSVMYRREHGVMSFMIDDDNCDCKTTLSMGHGMCGKGFSTSYGKENVFGVDVLYDPACQTPNNNNGLTLYFRDDDDCINVTCPHGRMCRDLIYDYVCE